MNRPFGLTLACSALGLLAALESLLGALLAFVSIFAARLLNPQERHPELYVATAIVCIACAAWSVFTAAGLLRLRNSARISVLVMAALMVVLSLFAAGIAYHSAHQPPPPGALDAPSSTMQNPPLIEALVWIIFNVIPGWWLVYFSLSSTRAYFLPGYYEGPLGKTTLAH